MIVKKCIKVFFSKYWLKLLDIQRDSRGVVFNLVMVEGLWKMLEKSNCYIEIKS